jgi:hypothetical protein
MLLRVNQETGPQIVLFRRGLAHFDRAKLRMIISTRVMQCVLRDRLKTWNKARPRRVSAVVKHAVVSSDDTHATACSVHPSLLIRITATTGASAFLPKLRPYFCSQKRYSAPIERQL